jgi:hypothetical protein
MATNSAVEKELKSLLLSLNPQLYLNSLPKGGSSSATLNNGATNGHQANGSVAVDAGQKRLVTSIQGNRSQQESVRLDAKALVRRIPGATLDPRYHRRLRRFYEKYNIYKLPFVAQQLREYKGHEEALFAALVIQYGPEPEDPAGTESIQEDELSPHLADADPPLPQGWIEVQGTRGDIYYRHSDGRRQWNRPTQVQEEEQQAHPFW